MLIQELKETSQDQAHIFQDPYFKSFQIHLLTIMYCFEHTNHRITQNVSFQNLYKLFWRERNLHRTYLAYSSVCKDLLFHVMIFYWIFPDHAYINKDKYLFVTIKKNLLLSWLENSCVLKNSSFNFPSNLCWLFLLQQKHFYSNQSFKKFMYLRKPSQNFNSTCFTFFTIMSEFTFNSLSSFRGIIDKIW